MKKRIVFIFLIAAALFALAACADTGYKIIYKTADGVQAYTEEVKNDTEYVLPVPEMEGYVFAGWYYSADFSGDKIERIKVKNSADITLYSKFLKKYSVTYISNGGTHTNPVSVTKEDITELNPATKSGYKFAGWYKNSDFSGEKVDFLCDIDKNITLYARFLTAYRIVYDLDGGVNSSENPYEFCAEDEIFLASPEKKGYSFKGWYNDNGEKVTMIYRGTESGVALTAKWEIAVYTISWDLVGGTVSGKLPTGYSYGETIPEEKFLFPTKSGMVFAGWFVKRNNSEEFIKRISPNDYGNLSIYAKWVSAEQVSYDELWKVSKQTYDAVGNAAYVSNALSVGIPEELKYMAQAGKLGAEISGTLYANVQAQGNATATAKAYLIVNGAEYEVASSTAKGGGYDYWHGFWTVPISGSWSNSGNRVKSVKVAFTGEEIKVGYRYYLSSDKTNDEAMTNMSYGCKSIKCKFYIL